MLKKHIKNKFLLNAVELVIVVTIAALIYFTVFQFASGTGVVNGVSMEPTLYHGELVLISKLSYKLGNPALGDIIAFPYPPNPEKTLIKRVIGIGGDIIDNLNGTIYLNGELLPEQYRMDSGGSWSVSFPLTVPQGTVFVLGDNRWASEDSRYHEVGCINVNDITGKVVFRLKPINKVGFL